MPNEEEWALSVAQSCFFVGNLLETEVLIEKARGRGRVLLASVCFFGKFLADDASHTFIQSVPIPILVDTVVSGRRQLGFSLLLPGDIPPTYYGIRHAIVYGLTISLQGEAEQTTKSLVVELKGEAGAKYSLLPKRILPQALARCSPEADSPAEGCGDAYSSFVRALRREALSPDEDELAPWISGKEGREPCLDEKIDEDIRKIVSARPKPLMQALLETQENLHLNPLLLYSAINHNSPTQVKSPPRSYIVKKDQLEIAHLSVETFSSVDAFTTDLIHLTVKFLRESSVLKVVVEHMEDSDRSEVSQLISVSRNVRNCTFLRVPMALDACGIRTLSTSEFVSRVVCNVEIDDLFVSVPVKI